MKLLRITLAAAALVALLAFAAPATAAGTQSFHATFVRIGGATASGPCGSGTISRLGHVANQCIVLGGCGTLCAVRTITFDDGSTLVTHESIVGVISPGGSSAAGANGPHFLEITLTIFGGTGRFAGATGSGTGRVNLAATATMPAVVTASGTITFP